MEQFNEVRLIWTEDANATGKIVAYRLDDNELVVQSVTHGSTGYTYDLDEINEALRSGGTDQWVRPEESTNPGGHVGRWGPKLDVTSLPWCLRRGW